MSALETEWMTIAAEPVALPQPRSQRLRIVLPSFELSRAHWIYFTVCAALFLSAVLGKW